jgi:ArsR family transcriptional regulator
MVIDHPHTVGGEFPEDPEDLLPTDSILSLDEYLAMHAAVGHRTRYEICYRLVHGGEMSPTELEETALLKMRYGSTIIASRQVS